VRKIPALIVVAGLLATLTACSTSSAPGSSGCTTPVSGDASSVVTATGSFGSAPTVHVPSPLITAKTETSTVIQGKGQVLVDGTPALIRFSEYSGATGKKLSTSSYSASTSLVTVGSTSVGPVADAIACSAVGSRLVVAAKASETKSAKAKKTSKPESADVYVIDVVKAFLPKANGALQLGVNNMPAVVTAPNGAPGITIPDRAAPTSDSTQLIRAGKGAKLTKADSAIVQLTAVTWATPSAVQGSTWTSGDAATSVSLSSTQIPAQIRKALIGQRVGSQVMAVITPTAASGSTTAYVYVFDILGSL